MRFLLLFSVFFTFNVFFIQTISAANNNIVVAQKADDGFGSDDLEGEFSDTEKEDPFDPLSGYNDFMTHFNDGFYINLLKPVSKGYSYVIPELARDGVSNVFDNLMFPQYFVNNLLQMKAKNSGKELLRFIINSTIGILGIFDPASSMGIEAHKEDFGQTLGHYGVGSGFHVVLPILGPSNLRDIVGLAGDYYADPISYVDDRCYNLLDNDLESIGVKTLKTINYTSLHPDEYENLKKDAIDLYPFLRDVYEQNRDKKIAE